MSQFFRYLCLKRQNLGETPTTLCRYKTRGQAGTLWVKDFGPFGRNLAKLPFYGFEQWGTNKQSAANKTQTIVPACTLHIYSC